MLVSLKLGADFRGGVQTQQCNRQSQRPTPSLLDSRIDSERRALTTLLVRVMHDCGNGLARNPFKALWYISPLLDTTTPASASL